MRLNEVIELFAAFNVSQGEVRSALAQGDGAFNAFEGLKAKVDLCWLEWQERVGRGEMEAEHVEALRETYRKLAGLKLTCVVTYEDIAQVFVEGARWMTDKLTAMGLEREDVKAYLAEWRRQRLAEGGEVYDGQDII